MDGFTQGVGVEGGSAREQEVRGAVAAFAAQRDGCKLGPPTASADLRRDRLNELGAARAEWVSRSAARCALGREEQVQGGAGNSAQLARQVHRRPPERGQAGNQVCSRSLMNVLRSSPRMSKMERRTMAKRMMISANSIKLCAPRLEGKRDIETGRSFSHVQAEAAMGPPSH